MFDRSKFRRGIQKELYRFPRDKRVAFAVRASMRALPLLATRNTRKGDEYASAFGYWDENDRAIRLLAILRAYGLGIGYVLNGRHVSPYVTNYTKEADAAANAANVTYAAYGAHVAANGAAYSDTYSAYAASNTVSNAANSDALIQAIKHDLFLMNHMSTGDLLEHPLWTNDPSNEWRRLYVAFQIDVNALNAGFEVWLDWYADRLYGKALDAELLRQWLAVPPELEAQGPAAVNAYIKNLAAKTLTQPLNRVRAIFIGYGEAGKTSLIRVLHDEPVVEGKEEMTAGIAIRDWPVPGSEIKAHFWDFGGQVMAHATHQFFLRERCLYVLVLNARSEINATEQAEYWLEHVRSFGKNAPVMIVGNKSDQAALNLDMGYLKGKYPTIVDFYPLSCTQVQGSFKAKFESFREDFCRQLLKVGTHQMLFTPEQFAVLQALRESSSGAFLKRADFIALCEKYGIGEEGVLNREWLLDILDKLGVVIHFPQLPYLDEYVLNPRWLTHGVYTLMYQRRAKLKENDVLGILRDKQISDENGNALDYPVDKCGFIMDAMREFKLCYQLRGDRRTMIIPELLPTDQPVDIPFEKFGALSFEFVFRGFLPRNVMPELIVSRHEEIVEPVVWQRGGLLKHQRLHAEALLQVDYHARVLSIWVRGQDAKDYLALLNDELLKILGRMELAFEERVELPLSARINPTAGIHEAEKVSYRQLLNSIRNGMYVFPGAYSTYDLKIVLGIIMSDAQQAKQGITINGDVGGINMSERRIQVGSNVMVGDGSFVSGMIQGSFNSLQGSRGDDEIKRLLDKLLAAIEELNAKVPASPTVVEMSGDAKSLIRETSRESPRKSQFEESLTGIKDAAVFLGETAKPVWELAERLSQLLVG